jgi:signal transduction histidine kinase
MVLEHLDENEGLDEREKKSLTLAKKECGRISRMITSLQDFYRPSSGVIKPLDINHVIEEILLILRNKLKVSNVDVIKNFAENIPKIHLVSDQIKQVFLNIISNAEEAMSPSGGLLTIQTRVIGNKVQVLFKDTGQGILEKNLRKIFEPFFTTKQAVKGTGLGLSVSYGIIKRHKGNIFAGNNPDQGCVFTVELPITGNSAGP